MMTRREVALGGLLTIITGTSEACCQSLGSQPQRRPGCLLSDGEASVLLSKSSGDQFFATGNETLLKSSGDRKFDYALAQTLHRITKTLQVLPGFAFYDDGDQHNAYATSFKRLEKADGTVLFGLGYLRSIRRQLDNPDVAVTAVCAHEFGHIVQIQKGLTRRLVEGQETHKRRELHADFLSGFYAGVRKLEKPDYPAAVFVTQTRSMGDRDVNDQDHHGTPEERAAAIIRGFDTACTERRSLAEGIQIGVQYVSTL